MSDPKPKPTPPTQTVPEPPRPSVTGTGSDTIGGEPAAVPSKLPRRVGKYRLIGELGRGGMGVVFRAEDTVLKREVALKVMLPKLAANASAKARFLREARAQAKVDHEHVAVIHNVEEHEGIPYLVMPLLKGMTLHEALRANPRPPLAEVLRIAREVAEGLSAAHEQGLVHRDIKPANVWLEGKRLRVKVLDFGLARAVTEEAAEGDDGPVTREGAIVGTPVYMSPEQGRGQTLDGRTDLWSLGVMLYQMTTGEIPFKGANAIAVLTALALETPAPPIARNPTVPPAVSDLVMRLLSKDPAGRPATAEAVADELRAIEESLSNSVRAVALGSAALPVIVAPAGPDPFADLDATEPPTANDNESPERTAPARRAKPASGSFPVWPMVVGVILAVGGLIWFVASKMGSKPPEVAKQPEDSPKPKEKEKEKLPKKDTKLPTPGDDRAAARKLLPEVESLTVRLQSGTEQIITAVGPFPDEKFVVTKIVTTSDWMKQGQLRPAAFVPAVLLPAVEWMHSLTWIEDFGTIVFTEADLLRLAAMPCRESLMGLRCGVILTPKTLDELKRFRKLKTVFLVVGPETSTATARLAELGEMDMLDVVNFGSQKPFSEGDWIGITGAARRCLSLTSKGIDGRVGKLVAGVPKLSQLWFGVSSDPDEGALQEISRCSGLTELAFFKSAVPEDGLKHLVGLKTLTTLRIHDAPITEVGLAHLAKMSSLRTLELPRTGVTVAQARELSKSIPRCRMSYVEETTTIEPSDVDWVEAVWALRLGGHVTLAQGTVRSSKNFTPETLPDNPFKLVGLNIGVAIPDGDVQRFAARLPELDTLVLSGTGVTDSGLKHLAACKKLKSLNLTGTPVTSDGLLALKGLPLEKLHLSNTKVADVAVPLLASFDRLEELSLANCPIGNDGADGLAALKSLKTLDLKGTRVTKDGHAKLQQALPNCKIDWPEPKK